MQHGVVSKPFLMTSSRLSGGDCTLAFVDKATAESFVAQPRLATEASIITRVIAGKAPVRCNRKLPWMEVDERDLPEKALFGLHDVFGVASSRPSTFGPSQITITNSKKIPTSWEAAVHYQYLGEEGDGTLQGIDVAEFLPLSIRPRAAKAFVNYARIDVDASARIVGQLRLVIDDSQRLNSFLMTNKNGNWFCNDRPELQTPTSMVFNPAVACPDQLAEMWQPTTEQILHATAPHLPVVPHETPPVTWRC